MFDTFFTVDVEFCEVDRILVVILFQEPGSEVGDEVTETRGEIVCCPDSTTHVFELDVFAITRKDTYEKIRG